MRQREIKIFGDTRGFHKKKHRQSLKVHDMDGTKSRPTVQTPSKRTPNAPLTLGSWAFRKEFVYIFSMRPCLGLSWKPPHLGLTVYHLDCYLVLTLFSFWIYFFTNQGCSVQMRQAFFFLKIFYCSLLYFHLFHDSITLLVKPQGKTNETLYGEHFMKVTYLEHSSGAHGNHRVRFCPCKAHGIQHVILNIYWQ